MAAAEIKTKDNVAKIQSTLRFLSSHDGDGVRMYLYRDSMSDVDRAASFPPCIFLGSWH